MNRYAMALAATMLAGTAAMAQFDGEITDDMDMPVGDDVMIDDGTEEFTRGFGRGHGGMGSMSFVDEDGDGMNDLAPDHDGDGISNHLDEDYAGPVGDRWVNHHGGRMTVMFVDEDGDGINDLAPDDDGDGIINHLDEDHVRATGMGHGRQGMFVDEDGDGVNDMGFDDDGDGIINHLDEDHEESTRSAGSGVARRGAGMGRRSR